MKVIKIYSIVYSSLISKDWASKVKAPKSFLILSYLGIKEKGILKKAEANQIYIM